MKPPLASNRLGLHSLRPYRSKALGLPDLLN